MLRSRVCLTYKLGNSNHVNFHLFLRVAVWLFHTGNKSFLSAQSSSVWVLWPFNGSFHNSSVFYYHVYKGPIVHRHEKIGDKYALSATTTHHYFHPGISLCLAIGHYLTTYEDIYTHQVLWTSPTVKFTLSASPFLQINTVLKALPCHKYNDLSVRRMARIAVYNGI